MISISGRFILRDYCSMFVFDKMLFFEKVNLRKY